MSEKIALVTGASRGIGAAMAEALAADYHVIAVAKTTGALEELDDRIQAAGGQATLAPMDVTNDDAMRHLCRSIHDRWGKLDLWVHAAIHAPPMSPAPFVDEKDFDKTFACNVRATSHLITFIEPLLNASNTGTAVFLDDPRAGAAFFGAYGASKAAQIALARSWAAETVKTGPRVVIATPAPMASAIRARFFPGEDKSVLADTKTEAAKIIASL
ncbi:SDR family NAD(P)-dependent oxidoreductase [Pseudogemmobacter sp. W21_MBD1_M6]|uniref:SDR family NAD(P)-dependent oxidoreductase n=1 Tax=Pseudogemmobacter sp. W21_MBD1_M6 TaxID=3240271 RepID=UPI003F974A92